MPQAVLRHKQHAVAEVARRTLGRAGRQVVDLDVLPANGQSRPDRLGMVDSQVVGDRQHLGARIFGQGRQEGGDARRVDGAAVGESHQPPMGRHRDRDEVFPAGGPLIENGVLSRQSA